MAEPHSNKPEEDEAADMFFQDNSASQQEEGFNQMFSGSSSEGTAVQMDKFNFLFSDASSGSAKEDDKFNPVFPSGGCSFAESSFNQLFPKSSCSPIQDGSLSQFFRKVSQEQADDTNKPQDDKPNDPQDDQIIQPQSEEISEPQDEEISQSEGEDPSQLDDKGARELRGDEASQADDESSQSQAKMFSQCQDDEISQSEENISSELQGFEGSRRQASSTYAVPSLQGNMREARKDNNRDDWSLVKQPFKPSRELLKTPNQSHKHYYRSDEQGVKFPMAFPGKKPSSYFSLNANGRNQSSMGASTSRTPRLQTRNTGSEWQAMMGENRRHQSSFTRDTRDMRRWAMMTAGTNVQPTSMPCGSGMHHQSMPSGSGLQQQSMPSGNGMRRKSMPSGTGGQQQSKVHGSGERHKSKTNAANVQQQMIPNRAGPSGNEAARTGSNANGQQTLPNRGSPREKDFLTGEALKQQARGHTQEANQQTVLLMKGKKTVEVLGELDIKLDAIKLNVDSSRLQKFDAVSSKLKMALTTYEQLKKKLGPYIELDDKEDKENK